MATAATLAPKGSGIRRLKLQAGLTGGEIGYLWPLLEALDALESLDLAGNRLGSTTQPAAASRDKGYLTELRAHRRQIGRLTEISGYRSLRTAGLEAQRPVSEVIQELDHGSSSLRERAARPLDQGQSVVPRLTARLTGEEASLAAAVEKSLRGSTPSHGEVEAAVELSLIAARWGDHRDRRASWLTALSLRGNELAPAAAKALASAWRSGAVRLTQLDLSQNPRFGEDGGDALGSLCGAMSMGGLSRGGLEGLDVSGCGLGHAGLSCVWKGLAEGGGGGLRGQLALGGLISLSLPCPYTAIITNRLVSTPLSDPSVAPPTSLPCSLASPDWDAPPPSSSARRACRLFYGSQPCGSSIAVSTGSEIDRFSTSKRREGGMCVDSGIDATG